MMHLIYERRKYRCQHGRKAEKIDDWMSFVMELEFPPSYDTPNVGWEKEQLSGGASDYGASLGEEFVGSTMNYECSGL